MGDAVVYTIKKERIFSYDDMLRAKVFISILYSRGAIFFLEFSSTLKFLLAHKNIISFLMLFSYNVLQNINLQLLRCCKSHFLA